ncbi:MAG TPA: hypothetical protein VFH78_05525 [Candidatus Thermoplasmatota archaeon]|nr:hypothetical protein [Candidatus Thermoplasmatota archaeon]
MEKEQGRIHQKKGEFGNVATADPEFPQLTQIKAQDRQFHIERAIEMGMSREEAERHAEHDLEDREESERSPPSTNGTV